MFQTEFFSIFLYCAGTVSAVGIAAALTRRSKRPAMTSSQRNPECIPRDCEVYTLTDGEITGTSFAARRQLDSITVASEDTSRLRCRLAQSFENAPDLLADVRDLGDMSDTSRDGQLQIVREVAGNEIRLEVSPRSGRIPPHRDVHDLDAAAQELRMLRANTQSAPFLLWRQNGNGEITWANKSYLDAVTKAHGQSRVSVWPLPSLFDVTETARPGSRGKVKRLQTLTNEEEGAPWFDCHAIEVDGDVLCTAFPADEIVKSETRRQEFTQTLTKTFSDLAIGLAIFDRSRRVALFNPALCDLTSLSAEFLASRPSLLGFLDQLREKRVVPEPRDYRAWRQSIAELEEAAMNGSYSDTWSLPDGQTFKVSGRPHPDGALALLIEDISAELSLTRRFRAKLEQSQSVIDSLDEAVAIFSASGELTFTNNAYKALWRHSTDPSAQELSVVEATRHWHSLSVPTPIWGDFRDFAFQTTERDEWSAEVTLRDGRTVACRFVPQKAGSSLAIFQLREAVAETAGELRKAV